MTIILCIEVILCLLVHPDYLQSPYEHLERLGQREQGFPILYIGVFHTLPAGP